MEQRSSEEARTSVESYALEAIAILKKKKQLDDELKEIKQHYKEEGVPVQIVSKVISIVKSNKKKTASERFEVDTITEWLENNPNISNGIDELI